MMNSEFFSSNIDKLDKQILALLEQDAKMNTKEIASLIGLTVTPTFERIKRLEAKGFIDGYHAKLNKTKLGITLKVMCLLSLKSHANELIDTFENEIIKFSEVSACYHIAGQSDYLVHIDVQNMEAYSNFLKDKLATIPYISNVQSMFVMKSLKE